jgi:hypothetical protein
VSFVRLLFADVFPHLVDCLTVLENAEPFCVFQIPLSFADIIRSALLTIPPEIFKEVPLP